jgi:hypothetical protein
VHDIRLLPGRGNMIIVNETDIQDLQLPVS